jgi:CubicO group peptidase (beta-lactamase class C family)
VFTVLSLLQLHGQGRLSLDDSVDKYVSFLGVADADADADVTQSNHYPYSNSYYSNATSESIVWSDITLRSLASQLSGLPRDWAQGDLLTAPDDPTAFGLPPVPASAPERAKLPKCNSYTHSNKPCTAHELLAHLRHRDALFAPGRKSTYSNIAFELLGLVIANVTGTAYEEAITASILRPLGMVETSFAKPPDEVAVLPHGIAWYWDVDEGVQNPTGGLYCSAGDMSIFLRHVLAEYMDIGAAKMNWMPDASLSGGGSGGSYGMPWEIFRTEKILGGGSRSVAFFTKGGGLPGYRTVIVLVPEFDLGITIFTAGEEEFLTDLIEMVTVPLIRAADRLAARQVVDTYVGEYSAFDSSSSSDSSKSRGETDAATSTLNLNSSLSLTYTPTHGLEITRWISNSTDMLAVIPVQFKLPPSRPFHAQLIPTFLYRDRGDRGWEGHHKNKNKDHGSGSGSSAGAGELWRMVITLDKPPPHYHHLADSVSGSGPRSSVWDDLCIADIDIMMYAGKPLNEVVFWDRDRDRDSSATGGGGGGGRFGRVELSAFRVNLTRVHTGLDRCGAGEEGTGKKTAGDLRKLHLLVQESG